MPEIKQTLSHPTPIWMCKIGTLEDGSVELPTGCDLPMRLAIQDAYKKLTGKEPDFIFSGWSAELTEGELNVL